MLARTHYAVTTYNDVNLCSFLHNGVKLNPRSFSGDSAARGVKPHTPLDFTPRGTHTHCQQR